MQLRQLLQRAALSGSLLAAGPLTAAADAPSAPFNPDTARIHGSDRSLRSVQGISRAMRRLAEADILVISRSDLIHPDEERDLRIMQRLRIEPGTHFRDIEALKRMRDFLRPYQPILTYALQQTHIPPEPGETRRITLTNDDLLVGFHRAVQGNAAARLGVDPETQKTLCEITAPNVQDSAVDSFRAFAHLPAYYDIRNVGHIRARDIYEYIMLHEAAHCGQHQNDAEGTVEHNLVRLENEIDADAKALAALRARTQGNGHDAAYYRDIVNYVQAARAMGALRHGTPLFPAEKDFPTHVTHVFGAHEKLDFSYDVSDVALSTLLVSNMTNILVGSHYTLGMMLSHDPGVRAAIRNHNKQRRGDDTVFTGLPLGLQDFAVAGRQINADQPAVQLGAFRALRDYMDKAGLPDKDKLPMEYRIWSLSKRLLENYISAADRYVPALARDPLVVDIQGKMTQALVNMTAEMKHTVPIAAAANGDGTATPLPTALDVLNFLHRLGQQVEAVKPAARPRSSTPTP